MIFNIKNRVLIIIPFYFFVVFFTGCALKIGEAPPENSIYSFLKEEYCSHLNYKKTLKNYFFELSEVTSDQLTEMLSCLSLQVRNISSLIYNEFLTREELLAVLETDFIDFQNLKEPLKKILAPDFHQEFSLYKNYIFDLIDPHSELNSSALCMYSDKTSEDSNLGWNDVSSSSVRREILFSKTDIDSIINSLTRLQKLATEIEQKSQFVLQSLIEYELAHRSSARDSTKKERKPLVYKKALYTEERFLNFVRLLKESTSDFFPSYSLFLRKQLELATNKSKATNKNNYHYHLLQKEIYPIFKSLDLFSHENRLHLLDIKYLFIMLYSVDFIFQKYDQNNNLMIDDEEIYSFSCLIEPFISNLMEKKLKDRSDWIQNYYRSDKIIRYIFKHQNIPGPLSVKYLFFDPDEEIMLSFKETYSLIHLLFESGLKDFESLIL